METTAPKHSEPATEHSISSDPDDAGLEALLGRAAPVFLRAGFAERVIQAVQPSDSSLVSLNTVRPAKVQGWIALAAAFVFCGGLVWWNTTSPVGRFGLPSNLSSPAPTEEELLLRALATLESNSGDLALVAQLGDVLEAELAERTSWLEKE